MVGVEGAGALEKKVRGGGDGRHDGQKSGCEERGNGKEHPTTVLQLNLLM